MVILALILMVGGNLMAYETYGNSGLLDEPTLEEL